MKENKKLVPPPPALEEITEVVQANVTGWIEYFKKLSPRILIKLPARGALIDDPGNYFDSDELKKTTIEFKELADDYEITDWPELRSVAFLLSYDSSLPGHKPSYLIKNTYLFCYRDLAFGIDYHEWDGDGEEDPCNTSYSLQGYPREALSWEYIKGLVKKRLIELQSMAPLLDVATESTDAHLLQP